MSESQLPLDHAVMDPRRVADSRVLLSLQMNPADANATGDVHGGTIMKLVDTAAGICATRHCRTRVVTVTMDSMSFLHPVYVGNVVTLYASVNDVGNTSLEVGVRVEALGAGSQQLTRSLGRLRESRRRLALLQAAVGEAEETFAVVTWLVPRK